MSKIEIVEIDKIEVIDPETGISPGSMVGHSDDPEARGVVIDVEVRIVKVKVLWAHPPKQKDDNAQTQNHVSKKITPLQEKVDEYQITQSEIVKKYAKDIHNIIEKFDYTRDFFRKNL